MIHSPACGVVLTLLATPADRRDPALSTGTLDAVLAALTTEGTGTDGTGPDDAGPDDAGPVRAANSLRVGLPALGELSEAERGLLAEWLDRITRRSRSRRPSGS